MSAIRTGAPSGRSASEQAGATREGQASATVRLGVQGMHCASCVSKVERELLQVPGVLDASVNLTTGDATVRCRSQVADVTALERAVERSGYVAHLQSAGEDQNAVDRQERDRQREYGALMRRFYFAAAISLPVVILSYPDVLGLDRWSFFAKGSDSLWWTWRALGLVTLPVLVWAGGQFYEGAWRAFRHREANMHADRRGDHSRLGLFDGGGRVAEHLPEGRSGAGVLRRERRGRGAGDAGNGARGQGQGPLLRGDPQADRPAGQDRARDPRWA